MQFIKYFKGTNIKAVGGLRLAIQVTPPHSGLLNICCSPILREAGPGGQRMTREDCDLLLPTTSPKLTITIQDNSLRYLLPYHFTMIIDIKLFNDMPIIYSLLSVCHTTK